MAIASLNITRLRLKNKNLYVGLRNETQQFAGFVGLSLSETKPTILHPYFLTIETVLAGLHTPYIQLMADQC